VLDIFGGARLTSASLPGDGFRTQHDAVKWRISEDLREMCVRARTEVYGLFAPLLPQRARDELGKLPVRKRQGIVPDFMIAIPSGNQGPSDAADELFELKTLHYGVSTYPRTREETRRRRSGDDAYSQAADARCAAVNRRAAAIPGEQLTKLRRLDAQHGASDPDDRPGPLESKLISYGPVRGLVFGHWAEASEHVESLLSGCAYTGALRHGPAMGASDPIDALGTLAWLLRRRWGMAAWRANARLLLDRLEHVGRGAARANVRRAEAMEYAATARRAAHWLFRRPRTTW
jgi:hypothetical protein